METFKKSKKSICLNCSNIKNTCSMLGGKSCGTDSGIGFAFVEKCTWFNKDIINKKNSQHIVKAVHRSESRVDMMGGGHNLGD